MEDTHEKAKNLFTDGIIRIARFWGLPKALGAIYSCLYLSEDPLSFNDISTGTGLTKGSISTNLRTLAHLKLVRKHIIPGERKDYYSADAELWDVVRKLLRQRQEGEFEHAIENVKKSEDLLQSAPARSIEADFSLGRITEIRTFFDQVDSLVAAMMALDKVRLTNMAKLFSGKRTPQG